MPSNARVGTLASLKAAASSRRLGAVTLQSFGSGLPLGLVWIALPAFLTYRGVDIRTVGLFSLAQAPWTFKFLWSPVMDRYGLRIGGLDRRRSWILVTELFLLVAMLGLAAAASTAGVAVIAAIALLIGFGSASQDIVIDAYAVEVLERSEQGIAVGARTALYRAAVLSSGAVTITLGQRYGWPPVLSALALLFIPLSVIVLWSPAPPPIPHNPRTLREAVFEPLLDIFRRTGALPILAFLVTYKFGENLATALIRPFLIQKCFVPGDVGLATATIGLTTLVAGTFLGGASTERIGLGRALWLFGAIQAVGFLGYIAVDQMTPGTPCAGGVTGAVLQPISHRLVMYSAVAVENFSQGLANGAFGVMLLRMTQKQFSATQYALFSSIFAIGRILPGPVAGFTADALGWTPLYLLCTVASVPGLLLLQRFAPLGAPEPALDALERVEGRPISRARLAGLSLAAAAAGFAAAVLVSAILAALKAMRAAPGSAFDLPSALARVFAPSSVSEGIRLGGLSVVGLVCGGLAAAFLAARHGIRRSASPG